MELYLHIALLIRCFEPAITYTIIIKVIRELDLEFIIIVQGLIYLYPLQTC